MPVWLSSNQTRARGSEAVGESQACRVLALPLIVQIWASYLTFPGLDLLYNEDNNTYFTRLLWKIKDRIHGNSFAQFPAHIKYLVTLGENKNDDERL